MKTCTVETKYGKVTGIDEGKTCFYRGIPYAITERFELPKEVPYWGELDATGMETDCYQYMTYRDESKGQDTFYHKEFRSDREFAYAESPMRLNIVTRKDAKNDPVLIFIHGGGFETGTIGELPYGHCTEYAKHNVVFVSLGYRLNVFYLYENGNYGLHDMEYGIRWVKENIEAFGGDPSRIVIMGQSAGAMSVMDLLLTQRLKGVITGAVTMSGGGFAPRMVGPWTKDDPKCQAFWANVRKRAGVETTEEYKKVDPELAWTSWYEESRENWSYQAVQPGIDGTIIPKAPYQVVAEGSYLDVPMICGVTSQDFMPYIIFEMTYSWAKNHLRQNKKPVYGYMFDRELPGNSFKAFHAADLWYMFGNMDEGWRDFEDIDYRLKDQMVAYVANFVKTGDPNGAGLPEWPAISTANKKLRRFDGVSDGLITSRECRLKEYHTFFRDKGPM